MQWGLGIPVRVAQGSVLSSFVKVLGGPPGYPRHIELRAHDPLRYVGDGHEFLKSLFGL